MPKIDDLGFGPFTSDKVSAFRSILQMHMAITRAVWHKQAKKSGVHPPPYLYIDLTAGPGYAHPHQPERFPGSPVIFLQLATSPIPIGRSKEKFYAPIPFEAHLFEKNPDFAHRLQQRLEPISASVSASIRIYTADYTDPKHGVLPLVRTWNVPHQRYGLIYVDPSGNIPDIPTLTQLAQMLPRVEILLHIAATTLKRRARAHNISQRLADLTVRIDKTHWLIRDIHPSDKHQWTFLLGTNANNLFHDLKGQRFYRLSSKKGQRILSRLTYTKREREHQNQLRLPLLGEE